MGPEIFNTLYFAILSTSVTLPIGVGAAVYIARFAKSGPFVASVRVALDTLASLPSIVYGLFGFLIFVVEMKAGYSLIAGRLRPVAGESASRGRRDRGSHPSRAARARRRQPRSGGHAGADRPARHVAVRLAGDLERAGPVDRARLRRERSAHHDRRDHDFPLDGLLARPFRGGETLAVHLWYVNSAGLSPDKADVSAGTAAVLVILVGLTNVLAARVGRLGGNDSRRKRAVRATR